MRWVTRRALRMASPVNARHVIGCHLMNHETRAQSALHDAASIQHPPGPALEAELEYPEGHVSQSIYVVGRCSLPYETHVESAWM